MSKFNFRRIINNIEQVKRELPRLLINDATRFFVKSFKDQGYKGEPWKEVQRRIEGTAAYKYPKTKGLSRRTKPILVMTGRLRRAVSNLPATARITYSKLDFRVKLEISKNVVPYADFINRGTDNMVKRQFMGDAPELRKIMRKRTETYLTRAFKT